METNFEISMELRPCMADGEEALFHKWITDDRILLKEERHLTQEDKEKAVKYYIKNSIVPIGYETVKTSKAYGLVEMNDGQIRYIVPTDIQFVDRKIDEYTFKY